MSPLDYTNACWGCLSNCFHLHDGLKNMGEILLLIDNVVIELQLYIEAQRRLHLLKGFFQCTQTVICFNIPVHNSPIFGLSQHWLSHLHVFPWSVQSFHRTERERLRGKERESKPPFQALFGGHSEENQRGATLLLASRTQHPENTIPNNINQIPQHKNKIKRKEKDGMEILTLSSEKMKLSWKITGMSSFVTYKIHIHFFTFPSKGLASPPYFYCLKRKN